MPRGFTLPVPPGPPPKKLSSKERDVNSHCPNLFSMSELPRLSPKKSDRFMHGCFEVSQNVITKEKWDKNSAICCFCACSDCPKVR